MLLFTLHCAESYTCRRRNLMLFSVAIFHLNKSRSHKHASTHAPPPLLLTREVINYQLVDSLVINYTGISCFIYNFISHCLLSDCAGIFLPLYVFYRPLRNVTSCCSKIKYVKFIWINILNKFTSSKIVLP
jgi:hypothetical protein